MSERNTLVRSMHDIGLAGWFGGSLAGAMAVNGAAADVPDPKLRLTVANTGWALGVCQWLIPALTGGISVLTALAGEQQRAPRQLLGLVTKSGRWLRGAA